jgi:YD repeat-containing protein
MKIQTILLASLLTLFAAGASAQTVLTDGVPANGNVAAGVDDLYQITVPAGATSLDIDVTWAGGDIADVLVKYNGTPVYGGPWVFDYAVGNADPTGEHLTIHVDTGLDVSMPALQPGVWQILVHGYVGGAYTIVADYSNTEDEQTLAKGVNLNGGIENADIGYYGNLAGAYSFDENDYYTFNIPHNATQVTFNLSGMSANLDLFARQGSAPVIYASSWDGASQNTGTSNESITINNPAGGKWYVAINGVADVESSYTISADYDVPSLTDGAAVSSSVGAGNDHLYKIVVPAGATSMNIDCTFSGGDIIDMLVSREAIPTYGSTFQFHYAVGNADASAEKMTLHRDTGLSVGMPPLQAGTWYILIHGYVGGAYSLVADYSETENGDAELTNGAGFNNSISNAHLGWYNNLAGTLLFDENDYYKITVPAGLAQVQFDLTGLGGNLNLYARLNDVPVIFGSAYGWSSTNGGTTAENITILTPAPGTYWLLVDGASNAQGAYSITASFTTLTAATSDILLQGAVGQDVTITGSGFTGTTGVTMGADVTVNFFQVISDSELLVNVDVANLADCGDRVFTVTTTAGSVDGIIKVEFPTNILPVVSNAEPSRNPAIGGVNVFLANGAFFKSETDIATRGRMMGLSWSRLNRSDIQLNGPLGQGWVGHYFQRAIYDGSSQNITWFTPDGRAELFNWNSTDWDSPTGVYVKATRDGGTGIVTLTDRHGFKCTFNAEGRLTACTDRNGNSSTCGYNADGQLISLSDDLGRQYEITYYPHGRVHQVRDKVWDPTVPRVIEYQYDAQGNLTLQKAPETARYSDANGNRTAYAYAYDVDHRLTECTNPREVVGGGGSYLQNTYDSLGRVIAQRLGTTGQNIYLRYTDDGGGNDLVREFDRRKLCTEYTLDASMRATKVTRLNSFWEPDLTIPIDHSQISSAGTKVRPADPVDSYATTFAYNANHEVTSILYARGNSVEYTYDASANHLANGNVLEVRRKDNALGALPDIVSSFTYESSFQFVKTSTNPRGFVTTYTYDYEVASGTAGNLVKVTAPTVNLGQTSPQVIETTTTYNAFGQPITSTDGEGNVTRYEYYPATGYLQKRITADGALDLTSEYAYDNVGNLTATWPPRAIEPGATKDDFKTSFDVNELNQTWHTTGKLLRIGGTDRPETYTYFDLNGNVTNSLREYVTWDGNEPAQPSDPNNPATFTKSPNAMAATWVETSATYNLLNYTVTSSVESIAGAAPTVYTTSYTYDANYNRLTTTTPLGFVHATEYDERELVYRSISAQGTAVQGVYVSNYDLNGNTLESFDANGNKTEYEYDGFDRGVLVRDAAGHYRTSEFDANSNVTASKAYDVGNTLLNHNRGFFDELDRAFKSETLAQDMAGVDIGDGWRTSTSLFDKNSRVTESTDDNGVKTTFQYDAANRTVKTISNVGDETQHFYNLDSAVYKTTYREMNGLTGILEISHSETDFDFMNRGIKHRDQRYNAITRDTETETFYDGWSRTVRRLDAANTLTDYQYDLLSRTIYSISRPTGSQGDWIELAYAYDDDSRTLSKTIWNDPGTYSAGQTTSYQYDARNRMTTLTRPDGDAWAYAYDANSNRTGWTDPLGTTVADSFDNRNLVTQRNITRGTGIKGATREAYTYDGLRRLLTANNFEDRGGTEYNLTQQSWAYNTINAAESHTQTIYNSRDIALGTWTTGARYDAQGLNTQCIYSDGRTLTHSYDGLNRLQATNDITNGVSIASYLYSARRLIERTYGNGTVTKVDYESSGCGCGGFSTVCERVRHQNGPLPVTFALFEEERRHDVIGNVTAVRRYHQGGFGEVYNYDDTYRLEDAYRGVPVQASEADALESLTPGAAPSLHQLKRHYNLDTRGNRTSTRETGPVGGILKDTSYSPDALTNVYDSIDGQAFQFDAIEQQTYDPTTGMYTAYDYKGNRVAMDDDSDFSSPERKYAHDTHSRMRVEEEWAEGSVYPVCDTVNIMSPDKCQTCGDPGIFYFESEKFDATSGSLLYNIQRAPGVGITGGGSAVGISPLTANSLPGGALAGNGWCAVEYTPGALDCEWKFRHENQLGSLIGVTNLAGNRIAEIDYGEYGQTYPKHILWDGPVDVAHSQSAGADTFLVYTPLGFGFPLGLENALLRCVHPGSPDPAPVDRPKHATFATVKGYGVDTTPGPTFGQNYLIVEDLRGHVAEAILEIGCDVTVLANYGQVVPGTEPVTSGHWDDVVYDGLTDTTTFTDNGATFPPHAVNWWLQPNAAISVYLDIVSIGTGQVIVAGDATGLAHGLIPQPPLDPILGTFYTIIWPAGVDPATGTLAHANPCEPVSRLLFAGYYYMPPVAGTKIAPDGTTGTTTYGQQPGGNHHGDYYCWNRVYAQKNGVWTTPDPRATPWANLNDYVGSGTLHHSDPTGLDDEESVETDWDASDIGLFETKTYKRRIGKYHGVKYSIEDCDCCYSGNSLTWFKDMLVSAWRVLTAASVAADNLKAARDKGVRGDTMGFPDGSNERKVLERFDWMGVEAGEPATDFIAEMQSNLDKMWRHVYTEGWHVRCYCDKDDDRLGWTSVSKVKQSLNGFKFYINCCHRANYDKNGVEMVNTLVHELSHLILGLTEHEGRLENADRYGDLAYDFDEKVESEFQARLPE